MRITANQVTMARIFLLPLPVYLLIYGGTTEWWIAFFLFVSLGATDFVDGLMARKEGPTKLGSLIDPVADKIFMAAIMLSMIAIGVFPGWVSCALLSREFLLTALRSSVAIRKEAFRTSRLAKLKTILQMGGCGTIFLTLVLPTTVFLYACIVMSLPFLAVALVYMAKRKIPPFWSLPVFLGLFMIGGIEYFYAKDVSLFVQMGVILAITWISAIDYLMSVYRLFRRTGLMLGDSSRLLWALVHGIIVAPLVASYPIMVLPVLVSMSVEFGLGGIDNIVVIEKGRFSSWPFFASSLVGIIFAVCINGFSNYDPSAIPLYASLMFAGSSVIIGGAVFIRHFDLFRRSVGHSPHQ